MQAERAEDVLRDAAVKLLQCGQRQFRQIHALRLGGFDGVGDHFVGVTKRQAFFDQIVGQVGGGGVAFFDGGFHGRGVDGDAAFLLAGGGVELAADHFAEDAQGVFERVHGVKQGLFVFLVVFVVGQGLAFHEGDQTHQMADHAAGFAAGEFGHVGVFLLRHDGRAGGESVGNAHKAKVLAHPQNELFAQAADMHHAQAGGGGELDGEVAVTHRVQAVLADLRLAVCVHHAERAGYAFAVQRVGGAGQRGSAQRQAVGAAAHVLQAFGVTGKHFHVGQQVVRKAHRLGHLQVGEAGHDDFNVLFGHVHQ